MLKVVNHEYAPLTCKVTFQEGDILREIYTDQPSQYIVMCNSNKDRFKNPQMFNNELTDEQKKRLAEVNALNVPWDEQERCLFEASDYVEFGYFRPEPREPFVELAKTKEEQSKQWFLKKHLADLANIRWTKEVGGAPYGEFIVASDENSISKITGTVVSFQAGILTETTFKFTNGWKTVNGEEMQKIAAAVSNHVDTCFKTEMAVKTILEGYTLKQLCPDTYKSSEDDGDRLDVKKLFDEEFAKMSEAKSAAAKKKK